MKKCMCMFCVDMRHPVPIEHDDYSDYSHDDHYDHSDQDDNAYVPNERSFAPFIFTIDQYDRLISNYDHLVTYKNIIELDRDSVHVMGKLRSETHDRSETHGYMVLQDITNLPLNGLMNAWFTTTGKILYVPWYAHNITACILGHTDRYADELECKGWFHYSIGNWRNRHNVKVTDRMYDAIAKFADQNNEDAALIAFGRK